jgi:hypothetical protein
MSIKNTFLQEWFKCIDNNFKQYDPQYCDIPNNSRVCIIYISIQQNIYLRVCGLCGGFDEIEVHKNDNIEQDIMTKKGLESYIDDARPYDNPNDEIIYAFSIEKDDNYNKLTENKDGINSIIEHIKEAIEISTYTGYILK